jgi:hypothetical protein
MQHIHSQRSDPAAIAMPLQREQEEEEEVYVLTDDEDELDGIIDAEQGFLYHDIVPDRCYLGTVAFLHGTFLNFIDQAKPVTHRNQRKTRNSKKNAKT